MSAVTEELSCEEWDKLFPATPCEERDEPTPAPADTEIVNPESAEIDSLVPSITDALAHFAAGLGVPIFILVAALTAYTVYGWYSSARRGVAAAKVVGGFLARGLRLGGIAVPVSAAIYGLAQTGFLISSMLIGQFTLLLIAEERGTAASVNGS